MGADAHGIPVHTLVLAVAGSNFACCQFFPFFVQIINFIVSRSVVTKDVFYFWAYSGYHLKKEIK